MRGSLFFVLILPDGSKSLVPAQWTDFSSEIRESAPKGDLVGSLDHLLNTTGS
jgi:hypothetical protein